MRARAWPAQLTLALALVATGTMVSVVPCADTAARDAPALGARDARDQAPRGIERSPYHRGDPHNAIVAVRSGAPLVALTFDDGPLARPTPLVLSYLRRERIHATFFVVGRRARAHPELVRRELTAGHEVGTHTWSHPLLPPLPARDQRSEIHRGLRALERAGGRTTRLFRPPHGLFDRRVSAAVAAAGLQTIGWDVAIDAAARGRSPQATARLLLRQVRPGSILLAHDTPWSAPRTIAVLRLLVPALRRRGLGFATVSELLASEHVAARPGEPAQRSATASSSPPSVPTSSVPSAASAG